MARCYAFLCSEDALDVAKARQGAAGAWAAGAWAALLACGWRPWLHAPAAASLAPGPSRLLIALPRPCPRPAPQTLAMVDEVGAMGLRGMRLLDHGHTSKFGHPVPTQARGCACGPAAAAPL